MRAFTRLWPRPRLLSRAFSAEAADPSSSQYEKYLADKLDSAFAPSALSVRDISGGCGSMFAINIVSKAFAGKPMVRQHRMVNDVLQEDIKRWHGIQLKTRAE
ncbi:bola protein [Limtongia smithiae]|uniref:bola protein n=1 Tax=Limtongia smithiae TaxID=1125753 RepID=UPI0034CE91E5